MPKPRPLIMLLLPIVVFIWVVGWMLYYMGSLVDGNFEPKKRG